MKLFTKLSISQHFLNFLYSSKFHLIADSLTFYVNTIFIYYKKKPYKLSNEKSLKYVLETNMNHE